MTHHRFWLALVVPVLAIPVAITIVRADAAKLRSPVYGPIEELTWTKTPIGPEASPVSGDFAKGKHVTYLRFPGKFKTPVHTHSADYIGIVLAGAARHYIPGDPRTEKTLAVGSHWQMPANVKHVSECISAEPCVFALIQDSKFDFVVTKN